MNLMRRVCIPIEFRPEGGGFYFLDSFAGFLRSVGWETTLDIQEAYEVLFTNHWMTPYADILRAIRRNPNVRIVQRIDGAAQNYGRPAEADERQARVNSLADLTIFQSQYARHSTRELFPVIKQDGPVIFNPVDLDTFTPVGKKTKYPQPVQVACVTWSTNPYKGAAQIYQVAENNPKVDFVLCGSFEHAPELPNSHLLGQLDRQELATALRSCRVMLTFSRNEACPNHVLEALASGVPVLYGDSGAMSEVIGECGAPVTVQNFAGQLDQILVNWVDRSKAARQRAIELFNPLMNFSRYMQVIEGAIGQPTHVPQAKRNAIAWAHPVLQRVGLA